MKLISNVVLPGLCLLAGVHLYGQSLIKGTTVSANNSPVPYASVLLLHLPDSVLYQGQISDTNGNFTLAVNHSGKYLLTASSVGFEPSSKKVIDIQSSNDKPLNLGALELKESISELGEVVVEGKRPFFEQQVDRTVINVGSNIGVSGGTALDVLERSPGVTVDRMNNAVSMAGKQGVRIMINGKLTTMPLEAAIQMLAGMNAENIEKIELITTPPAKYEAQGDAGMINIVLKESTETGFNGNASVFAGYGRMEKLGGNLNLNYGGKDFNIYGDYSYRNEPNISYWDSYRTVMVEGDVHRIESNNDRVAKFSVHSGRVGMDWNITNTTSIGGLVSVFNRTWDMDAEASIIQEVNGSRTSLIQMNTLELNEWTLLIGNINLTQKIGADQTLSLDVDQISYDSNNPTDYTQEFYFGGGSTLDSVGLLKSSKVTPIKTRVYKIDYSSKMGENFSMEAGAKASLSNLENTITVEESVSDQWQEHTALTSDAEMIENIFAGYVSTSFKLGNSIESQAGIRFEHTRTDIDTKKDGRVVDRFYGNFFPSLFLSKKINDQNSFVSSYSRRVNRPSFFQLAPFVIFNDPNSFLSGNERLLPSLTDAFKLEYRHKSLLLSLQYTYDKNPISIFQPRINDDNVMVSRAENMNHSTTYSLTISFPVDLTKWWEMQYNLIGRYTETQADYLESVIVNSVKNLNINGVQKFKLKKGFTVELSGFYSTRELFGIVDFGAIGQLNFGLEKKFNESSLRFSFNDIFNTNSYRIKSRIPEQNLNSNMFLDFETRIARLTYSWNFGNSKLKINKRGKIGSEEEQRRYQ